MHISYKLQSCTYNYKMVLKDFKDPYKVLNRLKNGGKITIHVNNTTVLQYSMPIHNTLMVISVVS